MEMLTRILCEGQNGLSELNVYREERGDLIFFHENVHIKFDREELLAAWYALHKRKQYVATRVCEKCYSNYGRIVADKTIVILSIAESPNFKAEANIEISQEIFTQAILHNIL